MRTVLAPAKFISAQTLTANFTSQAINVAQADVVTIQLNYTGVSPTGALAVQGSLDGINYAAIPVQLGTSIVTTIPLPGSTTPIYIDIVNLGATYVRVSYVFASGTGSMDGFISYRRIGE